MTQQARKAMEVSDVICGYTVYVDLVKPLYPEKELFSTPMMQEQKRCEMALEKAAKGKTVAMVCSGDAGVYGMAGLLLQLLPNYPGVEVEVVPGVTAANSGAAVLGAPLGHDFCVISLSDLLTDWEVIEQRLRLAAKADFAICLYNPRSHKRQEHLKRACEILMEWKDPETLCGWVKNIGREGQEKGLSTLENLPKEPIDMFTTVFIGSSNTVDCDGSMVTPRGYEKKR
jgi:precorrin-3B C17-methyltransferase